MRTCRTRTSGVLSPAGAALLVLLGAGLAGLLGAPAASAEGTPPVPPACSLSTTRLYFSVPEIGQSQTLGVTVTNTGGETLTGTVSSPCAEYTVSPGSYSLGPNQSAVISITYAPADCGNDDCTISFGAACEPVVCSAIGPHGSSCRAEPGVLDFEVGFQGQSQTRDFTLTNTGCTRIQGDITVNDSEFHPSSPNYNLGIGESMIVSVTYTPTNCGNDNAVVSLGTWCSTVACTAVGPNVAACTVAPASVNFGSVSIGQCSQAQNVLITNTGCGTLTGNVSGSCPDFEVLSGLGPYSLTPGQSRIVRVRFCPQSCGSKTCSIDPGNGACNPIVLNGNGIGALCSVAPSSIPFGSIGVGQCTPSQMFTITNGGCSALSGTVSESSSEFEILAGAGAYNLAPGESRTVEVRFCPQSCGEKTCTIETGASACADVICTGSGSGTACAVTPESLAFGTLSIGQCTPSQSFTLRNTGCSTLTGSIAESSPDFEIISGAGPFSLGTGQSRTVQVRFCPQSCGDKTCTIETGTPCAGPVCTGNGSGASCSVSPNTLAFDNVAVGECSQPKTFTITNAGCAPLAGSVTEGSPDYELLSGGGEYNLAPGEVRTVTVRFCPTSCGSKTLTIDTGTNACGDVYCTGTGGGSVCTVNPANLDFGAIPVGQCSGNLTATIHNNGCDILAGVVSDNSPDFDIVSGGGTFSLPPGQSRPVQIRFCPQSCGVKTAVIDTGPAVCGDITVSGIGGTGPLCNVSPTALTFETTSIGYCTQTQSVTVTNAGCEVITGVVSSSLPDFEITAGGGSYTLLPGQARTLQVRFCPQTCGFKNGVIDTGASLCSDITVSGTGSGAGCGVSPVALDFGQVRLGESSATQNFVILNDGCTTISGTIAETCGDFSVTLGGGHYVLAPGMSRTVRVRFSPQGCGVRNCVIDTGSNVCNNVTCTGVGYGAICSVSPGGLDFLQIPPGQTSAPRSFTITNSGCELIAGNISETSPDFQIVTGAGPFSINPGQSRVVNVRFTPQSCGPKSCTIETGLPACPNVLCTGTGGGTSCSVEPNGLAFSVANVGGTDAKSFVVRNAGCDLLNGAVHSPSNEFLVNPTSYSLASGDSVIVTVTYTPSNYGDDNTIIATGCLPVSCSATGPVYGGGACCLVTGACTLVNAEDCAGLNGVFQGTGTSCTPNPCPQPIGACCSQSGTCTVIGQWDCGQQAGNFQGPNTVCEPNPCPAGGACCGDDGSCQILVQLACLVNGGSWQGESTSCDPNPCPQPLGACCFPNGSCQAVSSGDCTTLGGTWSGAGTGCDPNPCPQPTGACCFHNGTCQIRTQAACLTEGGIWWGDATVCDPNPCPQPLGACCSGGGACMVRTESGCTADGGIWLGMDTTCDPNPCSQPTGACCYHDGSCQITVQSICVAQGGIWWGDGSSCSPNPCPLPMGACCFANGTCETHVQTACATLGGTWVGPDTVCVPNPCIIPDPPVGACCFPDGTCTVLDENTCGTQGGIWLGAATVCAPDPCPAAVGACCEAQTGLCVLTTQLQCEQLGGGHEYRGNGIFCEPNPCPQPVTGACCLVDGSCVVVAEAICVSVQGTYQGDNTVCEPNPCRTGACCLSTGECVVLTTEGCVLITGTYQGDNSVCEPNPCHITKIERVTWGQIKSRYR